jgi:hypothetical protein
LGLLQILSKFSVTFVSCFTNSFGLGNSLNLTVLMRAFENFLIVG